MPKLAIIHTTPVTLDSLKALAAEVLPGCEVVNFVDDSILPQLAQNGGDLTEVKQRWIEYVRFAEQVGADVILNACSSVGELVSAAQREVQIPVVRIDEAMAEEAVRRGNRIGVAATLATTLHPTLQLLQVKAEELDKKIELMELLAAEAYHRLIKGDKEGHDSVLANALMELAEKVDILVLAQASMARVVSKLPVAMQDKFLSSPRLGMERVRRAMEGAGK